MDRPYNRWLVVFAKEPKMGQVKSRLAQGLGASKATSFYRVETARLLRKVGQDPRWHTLVAVTPDTLASHDNDYGGTLPAQFPRWPQGQGDLGERMGRIFREMPPGPVVIVGSDIPALAPRHIEAAFVALGQRDVVFGPSDDGGYWLVGQKRCPKTLDIFANVRWSTRHALEDTAFNIPHRATTAFLETLTDIDTLDDYQRWIDERD